MKIGEFAKECGTRISALRHYDRIGLLRPAYIDRLTDYRYYDRSQMKVFAQISALKSAGFALSEIKLMLNSETECERLFESKKKELLTRLTALDRLRDEFKGGSVMNFKREYCVEEELPFENDERAVGKWQVLTVDEENGKERYLYFLPGGESYWCYGWTKGKLLFDNGCDRYYNDYRIEKRGEDIIMTIDLRSPDRPEAGQTTKAELKKIDGVHYTKDMIARKDDLNKPFVNDRIVIGKWRAFCYIDGVNCKKEEFIPGVIPKNDLSYDELYFKRIEFFEGGGCDLLYGDELISGDDMQTWTKGYLLRKFNSCACAYEIKSIENKDYLIIEWKSGDYRFGGSDTDYYAFVRE